MKKVSNAGQATIEFILVFSFGLSLILMIFNSAINYTTGYLVHYATFMASRTYLTSETHGGNFATAQFSISPAEAAARETFAQYRLEIFGVQNAEFFVNQVAFNQTPSAYLTVGTYTRYSQKVDILGRVAGNTELDLVSESFLGKEPTRVVCAIQTCKAMTGNETCGQDLDITLFDDGC